MLDILVTRLRDKNTRGQAFRQSVHQVSTLLAMEAARHLPRNDIRVHTPLTETDGAEFSHPIVIVPILRAGLPMLQAFSDVFAGAALGFIGVRRDHATALPHCYYDNLPVLTSESQVVIIDPTIATGGSAITAMRLCVERGAAEQHLTLVNIFAAPEGLENAHKEFPTAAMVTGHVDDGLNSHMYIVPGVGDFGDRFCGTEAY